jgi:23S rRNA G2069 N7-methylase RlmK/C1962 C5-methylase RlmI
VFSKSVGQASISLKLADLVRVEVPVSDDSKNDNTQLVGWGVYNPSSMYRVRILCHSLLHSNLKLDLSDPSTALSTILTMQFKKALDARRAMGLPSSTTDTYRLFNGEGDGLSGLAVDVIGGHVAVVMSSAGWCEVWQSAILKCLQEVLPDYDLIWKTTPSRLKQDGYEVEADNEEEEDDDESSSDATPVIGLENGVQYQTFPHLKGQKTSVYCDQRENRSNLAQLCAGKRVLDLCCYHGGFSLNAAKQEAASVVGVDSSQDAIDTCLANAELNGLLESSSSTMEFVKADISDYMQSCTSRYDVVVLDPPKLAPSVATLAKASRKYHSLNRDALKLIDDAGGLFMTCTCSAAMTQKEGGNYFLQMVHQASLSARREITLLRVSGAAPCHTQSPVSFPAGNYLTAATFYVHAKE